MNMICQKGHTIPSGKCYSSDCRDWDESDRGFCFYCIPSPSEPAPQPETAAMKEALHRIYELIDINRPYCDRCDDIRDIVMKFEGGR